MGTIYAVYLDVFLMQNFLLDGICLLGVKVLAREKRRFGYLRLFFGAFAGTILGTVVFFTVHSFWLYQILILALVQPLTVYIALRPGHWKLFGKELLCCFALYFLLGGILQFLLGYTGNAVWELLPWAVILFAGSILALHFLEKRRWKFCRCTLIAGEKRGVMRAMADSGNSLREPYTKRPVSIVSGEWKERLGISQEEIRLVPYRTVAGDGELMEVATVPMMLLERQGQVREVPSAVIGFVEPEVFAGKSYGMILHREYIN